MAYVEFLRARRALTIYTIVIAALVVLLVTSLYAGHAHVSAHDFGDAKHSIPLSAVFAGAAFGSLLFGTLLAASLNRERDFLALSWTRPIPRERMAAACMLVDFGAVVAAFVITLALGFIPLLTTGAAAGIRTDGHEFAVIAEVFAVTLMWYGMVQAATSWYRGRGGLVIGLSWPLFIFLVSMQHSLGFGPVVHAVAEGLNYLNPLAYLSSYNEARGSDTLVASAALSLTEAARISLAYLIGLATCAIAVVAWSRAEVEG